MMTSRWLLAAAAAGICLTAVPAASQAPAGPKNKVERGDDGDDRGSRRGWRRPGQALMRGIDLTDAQRTAIRDIHLKYRPRYDAIRDTVEANHQAGRRADTATARRMRALVEQERAELRAVLTVEQRKTFDANVAKMSERREKAREQRRGKRFGGR